MFISNNVKKKKNNWNKMYVVILITGYQIQSPYNEDSLNTVLVNISNSHLRLWKGVAFTLKSDRTWIFTSVP